MAKSSRAKGGKGGKGGKGREGGPSSGDKQLYWLGAGALVLVLAVDPERSGVRYVATHNGLIRAVNDADWARVGSSQDDYPHPEDPAVVYAAGPQGVYHSMDAGESWSVWLDQPAPALGIDPADPDRRFLSTGPELRRSLDGGGTWTTLPLDVASHTIGFLAFDRADTDTLYAATYQTGIYKTTDGGDTWTTVRAPSR